MHATGAPMLDDLLQRRPYNAVSDLIDANVARGLGGNIAFTDGERSLTYAELQARTFQFAAMLRTLGLRPEERVALLSPDTIDFPVAFWGGVRAGVIMLPLNTLLTAEQYAYILGDSRACTLVAAAPLARVDRADPRSAAAPAHRGADRRECCGHGRVRGPRRA